MSTPKSLIQAAQIAISKIARIPRENRVVAKGSHESCHYSCALRKKSRTRPFSLRSAGSPTGRSTSYRMYHPLTQLVPSLVSHFHDVRQISRPDILRFRRSQNVPNLILQQTVGDDAFTKAICVPCLKSRLLRMTLTVHLAGGLMTFPCTDEGFVRWSETKSWHIRKMTGF
jgi:hypothetical protein